MSGLAWPSDETLDAFGATPTIAGESISVDKSLRMADVFAAVNIISETVGMLPLKVFRSLPANAVEEAPLHRASSMLSVAPNPTTPAHRFWSTVSAHVLLWGNAFVEKLRDDTGLVTELWLLHPSQVMVEWNASRMAKRFRITDDNGTERTLNEDRVLHILGVSMDGLVGMSPIRQSREALGMVKARERFEGDVYARTPMMAGHVEHPKKMQTHGVKLRESWSAIYGSGGAGRGSVAVLEEGARFVQHTAPFADMQFVESMRLSRKQIANLFKLPAIYLNEQAEGSLFYQTVESNKIWMASQTIAPLTVNMQKFISADRGIFPFPSWYAEFVLEGLLRGEPQTRADFYTAMFAIKDGEGKRALSVDEIRQLENRPPAEKEKTPEPSVPLPTLDPATTDDEPVIP